MPNLILFDDPAIRVSLLPFTFTRPVAHVRVGIWTVAEKWANWLQTSPSFLTESYLQAKFPLYTTDDNLFVNGAVCPDAALVAAISELSLGQSLHAPDGLLLAIRTNQRLKRPEISSLTAASATFQLNVTTIRNVWDIFMENGAQIKADFARLTAGRESQPITDPHTCCYAPENIFVEPGAVIRAAVLNAENGPIYIDRNATVCEGSVIVGPFTLGESATVNWGAKMRANTSIGPQCKVGGEVSNSVFFGYSNKGHDGFLGNSVIGEWCNLGANTNNSNLKNDYTTVKIHSYETGQFEDSGQLFCGLFMGDYTKVGISTLFNTGTVVGVSVNVFGAGFQPKHIPSFSWGGAAEGFTPYRIEKALHVARETVARRSIDFTDVDEAILRSVMSEERTGPPGGTKNG